jgi:hypothetical protein
MHTLVTLIDQWASSFGVPPGNSDNSALLSQEKGALTQLARASSNDAKWQRGLSLEVPPAIIRQGLEDLWDDVGGQTEFKEEHSNEMVRNNLCEHIL